MVLGGIAAAAVSGVAYALLYAPWSWTALSWVCLVPLYASLERGRIGRAAVGGAVFMWVATSIIIIWVHPTATEHFGLGFAEATGLWVSIGLLCTAPFYAIALAGVVTGWRRCPAALRPWLFAAAWVAAEFVRTHVGLRSPWSLLGDAHADSAWLRQSASLGGVYLVSFVVALVNGSIGQLWLSLGPRSSSGHPAEETPAPLRTLAGGLAATALAVVAAVGFGMIRAGSDPAPLSDRTAVLVQGNVDPELTWRTSTARTVFFRYGSLTRDALARVGTEMPAVIVWPEHAIQVSTDDRTYGHVLRRLSTRAPLIVGAPYTDPADRRATYNSATLLHGEMETVRYDKRRLLPFSETPVFGAALALQTSGDLEPEYFSAGSAPGVFALDGIEAGLLICMEALYPELGRELAREGASLLVNLSNDGWFRGRGATAQHLNQVRFRAIETGMPLLRSTTSGVSAVIDPLGEVRASLDVGATGVLSAAIPETFPLTLYARVGDVFAWSCLAAWLTGLAAAASGRTRPSLHVEDAVELHHD